MNGIRNVENFGVAFELCEEADRPLTFCIEHAGVWKVFPSGRAEKVTLIEELPDGRQVASSLL